MLTEICAELKNYFLKNREQDIHTGTFTITDGTIDLDFLQNGQYFRIVGSVFNDGVHQYQDGTMTDETFEGAIWAMYVPKHIEELANEIESWIADNSDVINSPYSSESFGGYSYSKATGDSVTATWQGQFKNRLDPYRRLFVL